jgi:hypothetical protein
VQQILLVELGRACSSLVELGRQHDYIPQ